MAMLKNKMLTQEQLDAVQLGDVQLGDDVLRSPADAGSGDDPSALRALCARQATSPTCRSRSRSRSRPRWRALEPLGW